jgi:hypothetical protein
MTIPTRRDFRILVVGPANNPAADIIEAELVFRTVVA